MTLCACVRRPSLASTQMSSAGDWCRKKTSESCSGSFTASGKVPTPDGNVLLTGTQEHYYAGQLCLAEDGSVVYVGTAQAGMQHSIDVIPEIISAHDQLQRHLVTPHTKTEEVLHTAGRLVDRCYWWR